MLHGNKEVLLLRVRGATAGRLPGQPLVLEQRPPRSREPVRLPDAHEQPERESAARDHAHAVPYRGDATGGRAEVFKRKVDTMFRDLQHTFAPFSSVSPAGALRAIGGSFWDNLKEA